MGEPYERTLADRQVHFLARWRHLLVGGRRSRWGDNCEAPQDHLSFASPPSDPLACVHVFGNVATGTGRLVMTDIERVSAAAAAALFIILLLAISRWSANRRRARKAEGTLAEMQQRFSGVTDLDAEKSKLRTEIEEQRRLIAERETTHHKKLAEAEAAQAITLAAQASEIGNLRASYREKRATYDRLLSEIAVFDDRLAFAEMGVYEPHFDFDDSEQFKDQISIVRDKQKAMVTAKTAVFCTTPWTVDGSKAKGETMTNRGIRLTLRAFNNECDVAIANTRWNNVNAMEKRILRAREQIDSLNASNTIYIDDKYLKLKLNELYLSHEYREKQKAEREERVEMARAAREEQKFLRDLEQAQEEEDRYARLLARAKTEADKAVGSKLEAASNQVRLLEQNLAEAHAKAERAQAMAEKTRSGYVYIISNIGSFGEGVVKIGLTRRLDPLDRVRELGDASVPFSFDTHAIIYSDDAPTLERALHQEFDPTRLNAQNYRKEFFHASLEDVEAAVARLAPGASFFKDIEAQEYRETLARRNQALTAATEHERELFPSEI